MTMPLADDVPQCDCFPGLRSICNNDGLAHLASRPTFLHRDFDQLTLVSKSPPVISQKRWILDPSIHGELSDDFPTHLYQIIVYNNDISGHKTHTT